MNEVLAKLVVAENGVEVRKVDKSTFKPASDGQNLREGDTIRTDVTGLAEIDYTDTSYTRLDVNTTFTIKKLTEEQGDRQVQGSLETGQTWNRTAALTESGSFEQEGAGANAVTRGTAFAVTCDTAEHCTFTAVVHIIDVTGRDGQTHALEPLQQCDSSSPTPDVQKSGDLCGEVSTLTPDEFAAFQWIQDNLALDKSERGIDDGPVPFVVVKGTLVIENGQFVSFTPDVTPPDTTPPETTPPDTTPPDTTPPPITLPPVVLPEFTPPPSPVIAAQPVDITDLGDDPTPGESTGPNTEVVSQDERGDVTFTLQVTNPSGGTYWIVFTDLPAEDFGVILELLDCEGFCTQAVTLATNYAPGTTFVFDPFEIEPVCSSEPEVFDDCFTKGNPSEGPDASSGAVPYPSPVTEGPVDGSVQWSDTFTFVAQNDQGGQSAPATVNLVVVDDICTGNEGTREAEVVVTCPGPS